MKKVLRFLTLAAMLCIPWVTQAQCNISYELTDSYGDGWNGGTFVVTDVTTSTELANLTISSGASASGTIAVIDGHEISFAYTAGSYAYENSWVITDPNGTTIWSGTGNGGDYSHSWTAACPSCITPTSLAATLTPGNGAIATLNWTAGGTETNWVLEYGTASNFADATSVNVNGTPTANLTGLTAETQYYARVKADCGGGDVSDWSTTVTFTPTNAYTLTVNDGAHTSTYVPIHGNYCDYGNRSQFIIPSSDISAMQYGTINQLTFFANANVTATFANTVFSIYMTEVDYTEFPTTDFVDWATMEEVYSGSLTWSGTEWVFTLDNPYVYNGDNLLIGFVETSYTNSYASINWMGENQSGNTALSQYASSSHVYSSDQGTSRAFLPKVTFSYTPGAAPTCPKPTVLTLGAITASEAPLTWTAGGNEESWKVYLNGALVATVYTNSYNFNGLTANTDYTFGVAAVCGVDDESTIATVAGHTPCGTYAIPYSYGFETDADMTCWTEVDCEYDDYNYMSGVVISDPNEYAKTGDGCFFFSSYNGSTDPQYLISPQLTGIANGLHVEFFYRAVADGDSYTETFVVGYSTTDNATGSFTWGSEFSTSTTSYQRFSANYPAGTKYVAVKYTGADNYYLIIDDILFEEAASCLEPTTLTVNGITSSDATIGWTNGGEENTWDIYVTDDIADVPGELTAPTVDNTTTKPYLLTGLTPATTYYVYVRAVCDGSTSSAWSSPVTFSTECEAMNLPYAYGFESELLNVCWGTVGTNAYNMVRLYTTEHYNGSKSLNFYRGSASGDFIAVLPEVDDSYDLADYELTFWVKGSLSLQVGIMTDPTDASTFEAQGDAIASTGTWTQHTVRFLGYIGSGHYFAIKNAAGSAGSSYIDDLEVNHIPACVEPTAFANTAVTAHGATFSWTAGNSETAWQLYVSTSASDPADDIADNASGMYAVTTNPYTIASDLDAETDYYAWVRANCGNTDGKSVWVGPVAFTTLVACPAPTGLAVGSITNHTAQVSWTNSGTGNYNVRYRTSANITGGTPETFANSSTPTGWNRYTGLLSEVMGGEALTTSSNWGFSNYYVFPGDYHAKLNIYGTGCKHWLVTPETTLGSNAALGFDLALTDYSSSSAIEFPNGQADDRFVVLITTDDMVTWTILREWNNSTSPYVYNNIATAGQNVVIDLSAYDGETVKIAFYGESTVAVTGEDNDLHIDNVNIGTFMDASSWTNITATTNSKTLTDLDAETQYDVQVQDVCGGIDGESSWSATTFTTDIACSAPTGLAYAELKSDRVNLSWTSSAANWQVAYKADADDDFTIVDATGNPFTLDHLTPEVHYTVKVRNNCEASYTGDGYSEYTTTVDFTTLEACAQPTAVAATNITNNSATISWTGDAGVYGFNLKYRVAAHIDGIEETFGGAIPTGWIARTGAFDEGNGTATLTGTSSWSFGTNCGVFDQHAYFNLYSTKNYWLITPSVDLNDGDALGFDVAYTAYNTSGVNNPPVVDATHKLYVLISTDGMTSWEILRKWDNDGSPYVLDDIAYTGQSENIDLSAYDGETAYIAFLGVSSTSSYDNNIHIDNVAIGSVVPAGAWNNDNAGTNVGTATSHNITGLTAETKYEVQVAALCGTHPVSDPYFFTTLYGFDTLIVADRWYAISSPVHNSGNNETFAGVTNLIPEAPVEYDLLRWDQYNGKWVSSKPTVFTSFDRGQGYIYRRSADATLTFLGQSNHGNYSSNYLNFSCSDLNLKGFNLLGNPYPKAYTPTMDYYKLNANGTWTANEHDKGSVRVGEAFFVKATTGGYYTFTEPGGAKSVYATAEKSLSFTVSNDNYSDIAYVRFANNEGMPKMAHLNTEAPALSIPQGDRRYAIANLDENTESFPLAFNGSGEYTLTASNLEGLGYLHLIDRETGADVDMLRQSGYTFNANGNESERFVVLLRPTADANSFVRVSDSRLIVDGEGELQVFDVMGRQLGTAQVDGTTTLDRRSLGIVSAGVYVLRLNGNSQKIVVK